MLKAKALCAVNGNVDPEIKSLMSVVEAPAPADDIHCTAAMIKRYAPGIVDMIFGGVKAKDAITKCEKEVPSTEDELRSALEEALDGDVSEEAIGDLLAQLASELGIGEDSEDSHEDNERPESIRLNPFVNDGAGSDQPHVRKQLFGEEGGEA